MPYLYFLLHSYGDEDKTVRGQLLWKPVKHCTLILLNSCDLSDQTHKYSESYYARVRAMTNSGVTSNWTVTQRFEPQFESKYVLCFLNSVNEAQALMFKQQALVKVVMKSFIIFFVCLYSGIRSSSLYCSCQWKLPRYKSEWSHAMEKQTHEERATYEESNSWHMVQHHRLCQHEQTYCKCDSIKQDIQKRLAVSLPLTHSYHQSSLVSFES